MSVKKIIITSGTYQNRELRLLVSFDENDKPIDLINLDITRVGEVHEATVEKVLNDIDACILKLDCGEKGFIENKKLKPEYFLERHSENKLVCQGDKFFIQISQDKKGSKPYSCDFMPNPSNDCKNQNFISYYIDNFSIEGYEIVSDLPEIIESDLDIKPYYDEQVSLWSLYGLTSILDKALSKVVYLKSGANIIIEPTEALTVIDVNTSKSYCKASAMNTNIEALSEIAHQLKLRSISGIIIIDLLKVSKDHEKELLKLARELFSEDISQVLVHGFTRLGLLEITRSRIIAPFKA